MEMDDETAEEFWAQAAEAARLETSEQRTVRLESERDLDRFMDALE